MAEAILCGLIGAGIQRSLSPALHQGEAAAQGMQLEYRLLDLDVLGLGAEALPRLLADARRDGYRGLNITYPCKQAVMPLLDEVSDEARAIGAVNTVVIRNGALAGHNTDGPGWGWGFRRALPRADLSHVVLLGAGGAGSACADAVMRLGAKKLVVVDKEPARAAALAGRLNDHFANGRASASEDIEAALAGATGFIQATPVGMAKHPGMPIRAQLLRSDLWVSEVVYVPLETELLTAARKAGCHTVDGGHMNVGQGVRCFKLFTGRDADVARMDAHFRRLVS
jgi:shikimate dehydrogenase